MRAEVSHAVDDGAAGLGRERQCLGPDSEKRRAVADRRGHLDPGPPEDAARDRALDQVHTADEPGDEGRLGRAVDDVGRPDLLDAAVAHHDNPVGQG
jgi:hypothetical protein